MYYWKAEAEKKYRNRYTGRWRTVVPRNGYKVNRNDYKTIIRDENGVKAVEEFFNEHTKAYQCIVTCRSEEE